MGTIVVTASLFWPGQDPGATLHLPACRLLYDLDQVTGGDLGADLILSLPTGGSVLLDSVLGHLVACVDAGGVIAIHAVAEPDIDQAISQILNLAGGGRA